MSAKWRFRVYLHDPFGREVAVFSDDPKTTLGEILRAYLGRSDFKIYQPAHNGLPSKPQNDQDSRVTTWLAEQLRQDIKPVSSGKSIRSIFENNPDNDRFIDLVVAHKFVSEQFDVVGAMYGPRMRARVQLEAELAKDPSPSEMVKSPYQHRDAFKHHNVGRPTWGLPTTLYSPELAKLSYTLDHPPVVNRELLWLAHELIDSSLEFYSDEKTRQASLESTLQRLLADDVLFATKLADQSAAPFGRWMTENAARAILESKGETGIGGDPTSQGIASYRCCVLQAQCKELNKRCNMPAIIIGLSSTRLEISGAVFTDGLYADLYRPVDLRWSVHGASLVTHVAQVFAAVAKCMVDLHKFYTKLQVNLPDINKESPHMFPNPIAVPESGSSLFLALEEGLVFRSQLDRRNGKPLAGVDDYNRGHGLFLAYQKDGTELVVKFMPKYSAEAHRLLADNKLAPKLHRCTPVIGGLQMVVMDRVEGQNLHYYAKAKLSPQARKQVYEDVKRAIMLLHEQDLVFGDLRPTNIVLKEGEGAVPKLVDFDRCGKDGVERYSAFLNEQLYTDDIVMGGLMKKQHDIDMLAQFKEQWVD